MREDNLPDESRIGPGKIYYESDELEKLKFDLEQAREIIKEMKELLEQNTDIEIVTVEILGKARNFLEKP